MEVAIGSTFGACLGTLLAKWVDYQQNPGLYAMSSAPWYTGIAPITVITGAAILIEGLVYLLIRRQIIKKK